MSRPDDGAAPAVVVPAYQREDEHEEAAENETKPIQSIRRSLVLRLCDLGQRTSMATTPMGTLTKKIQRQPIPLVIAPPMSGPTATAPPITAP